MPLNLCNGSKQKQIIIWCFAFCQICKFLSLAIKSVSDVSFRQNWGLEAVGLLLQKKLHFSDQCQHQLVSGTHDQGTKDDGENPPRNRPREFSGLFFLKVTRRGIKILRRVDQILAIFHINIFVLFTSSWHLDLSWSNRQDLGFCWYNTKGSGLLFDSSVEAKNNYEYSIDTPLRKWMFYSFTTASVEWSFLLL